MEIDLSQKQLISVNKVAQENGFKDYNIQAIKGSIKGDNYMGIIKLVNINENNSEKKLSMILKESLVGEVRKGFTIMEGAYNREVYMYNNVFRELLQFQNEYNIKNKFNNVAKLYDFCTEQNEEFLIFENLRESGFEMFDRKKQMGDEHVSIILKTYGKFHALSYALSELKPKTYQSMLENLQSIFEKEEEKKKTYMESFQKSAIKAVGSNEKAIQGMKRFFVDLDKFLYKTFSEKDRFSVIKHGDCWCNNLMFKCQGSKAPTDVRILDWQLSSVGSPILDLAYFFYTCSSDEVINNHKKYLDIYYNSLSEMIKQFGIDPNTVFSRNDFDNEWKKYAKFGLYMAIFLINITLADSSDAPDLSQLAENGENIVDSFTKELGDPKEFQRRVTNIVLHMVDNDLI